MAELPPDPDIVIRELPEYLQPFARWLQIHVTRHVIPNPKSHEESMTKEILALTPAQRLELLDMLDTFHNNDRETYPNVEIQQLSARMHEAIDGKKDLPFLYLWWDYIHRIAEINEHLAKERSTAEQNNRADNVLIGAIDRLDDDPHELKKILSLTTYPLFRALRVIKETNLRTDTAPQHVIWEFVDADNSWLREALNDAFRASYPPQPPQPPEN